MQTTDQRWVADAAAGDESAFRELYRAHVRAVYWIAHGLLGSPTDAEDVTQETFVTAWQRFSDLDDPAKVKSWLMRIVSRKAVDRIRALRPTVDIDDVEQS
ncbi:sigma-70 family RNA polymerase sigma factor, partial [Pseudomonas sp. BGM005]|nr:sigma-70 family RNA polymerase sigma factor [Pseudomonas sp. BG5]